MVVKLGVAAVVAVAGVIVVTFCYSRRCSIISHMEVMRYTN